MINLRGLSLIFVFFLTLTTVMTSSFLLAQADQNEETLRRNLTALQKTPGGSAAEYAPVFSRKNQPCSDN